MSLGSKPFSNWNAQLCGCRAEDQARPRSFRLSLANSGVVPFTTSGVNGDPGATGSGSLVLRPDTNTIDYDFDITGLSSPITMGHIHVITADGTNPVVVDLMAVQQTRAARSYRSARQTEPAGPTGSTDPTGSAEDPAPADGPTGSEDVAGPTGSDDAAPDAATGPAEEPPAEEPPAGEQPAEEQPAEEQPAGEQPEEDTMVVEFDMDTALATTVSPADDPDLARKIREIRANPSNYYVNLHSVAYPLGAVSSGPLA